MHVRKLLDELTLTDKEVKYFFRACIEWKDYCYTVGRMDKATVLKLIKYLLEHRPRGNHLMTRALGRFNRLNTLKKEDLQDDEDSNTQ